jgi:energy-coupling factor transporter ATP-binding protein EcfA2
VRTGLAHVSAAFGAGSAGGVTGASSSAAAIEVRGLGYRFPDGTEALKDVTFSIAESECVGLVGPNGAGKSTLLLHLNGILPGSAGAGGVVRILGEAIAPVNLSRVRRTVGLLFQDPDDQLFCSTVREDVAFGPEQFGLPKADLDARVTRALDQVGLAGFEERLPHHLSRGEKKRVCLAGLLACEPRILVLDEPTSDLDPRARRQLRELLRALPVTLLIATHDLEMVVDLCSSVLVLDGGRIVAAGPTVEILSDEALMVRHGLEKPHALQHRHPH